MCYCTISHSVCSKLVTERMLKRGSLQFRVKNVRAASVSPTAKPFLQKVAYTVNTSVSRSTEHTVNTENTRVHHVLSFASAISHCIQLKMVTVCPTARPSSQDMKKMLSAPISYHTQRKDVAGPMLNETRAMLREWFKPWNQELAHLMKNKAYLWKDADIDTWGVVSLCTNHPIWNWSKLFLDLVPSHEGRWDYSGRTLIFDWHLMGCFPLQKLSSLTLI